MTEIYRPPELELKENKLTNSTLIKKKILLVDRKQPAGNVSLINTPAVSHTSDTPHLQISIDATSNQESSCFNTNYKKVKLSLNQIKFFHIFSFSFLEIFQLEFKEEIKNSNFTKKARRCRYIQTLSRN